MSITITVDIHPPADPQDLATFRDNLRDNINRLTYAVTDPKITVELTGEALTIRDLDAVSVAFAGHVLGRARQTIYRWLNDGTLEAAADGLVRLDSVLRIANEWRGQ